MKIGRGVGLGALWVENRHLPFTWPVAYTTACTNNILYYRTSHDCCDSSFWRLYNSYFAKCRL